jgi:hypothetical protein
MRAVFESRNAVSHPGGRHATKSEV